MLQQYYTDEHLCALALACVGRTDIYAILQNDDWYYRVSEPLTFEVLSAHVEGSLAIASYVITEAGLCRFAVFVARGKPGLMQLAGVQECLQEVGVVSYVQVAPAHVYLWVFVQSACSPALLRRVLLPYCPVGVNFYPDQDTPSLLYPGGLVRVPLGLYANGRRYPFVGKQDGRFVPYARNAIDTLSWLGTIQRVEVSLLSRLTGETEPLPLLKWSGIQDWCAQQNHFAVIGRYVELDQRGLGRCPFASSHPGSKSGRCFKVNDPSVPGGRCWYCYYCKEGGSVFDFLQRCHGLTKQELILRIRSGEQL